jgi:nucleoside-diphosphate-sugar epimerase
MMLFDRGTAIVTGCAGFIGSHLAERLVAEGYHVVGVDCFTDYYPRAAKEANLTQLRQSPRFRLLEEDILELDWAPLLGGAQYVFHEAAQPGVRGSWGESFDIYVRNNVLATQRLLEAAKGGVLSAANGKGLKGLIFASSSSVYGDAEAFPTTEDGALRPVSPYGVTKLACEHLCRMYHKSFGLPVVTMRYFTAFGPRQRPDMAFHRFIKAIMEGQEIVVYGDGEQTRDFTFVSDVVGATLLGTNPKAIGGTFNVGGGSRVTVNETIRMLEKIIGKQSRVRYEGSQRGDARHTSADTSRATTILGYRPTVSVEEGLRKEVEWLVQSRERPCEGDR